MQSQATAYQAGKSLSRIWSKKRFRIAIMLLAASYVLIRASSLFEPGDVPPTQGQIGLSQPVQAIDNDALAKAKADQDACSSARETKLASYHDLLKQGKDWEAAGVIRLCASTLNDPELKKLLASAEIRSYLTDIRSAKTSPADKLLRIRMLIRDYPDEGKAYEPKIAALEAQIAREDAVAEAAERRKHGVRIGMTADEVKQSSWGRPESVNRTITARGTHEQWVYGGSYLYFDDGVLTAIQN